MVGDIQRAAGDGKYTVLLALDISAVFDAVDHSVLGAHVNTDFAIGGTTVGRWIESFVADRSQLAVRRRWCGEVRNREACLGSPSGLNSGPFALCDVCVSDRTGGRHFWHSTSSVRGRPDALLRPYRVTARRPVTTSALF